MNNKLDTLTDPERPGHQHDIVLDGEKVATAVERGINRKGSGVQRRGAQVELGHPTAVRPPRGGIRPTSAGSPCGAGSRRTATETSLGGLPQHPDEHRPQRPILLAVDQASDQVLPREASACASSAVTT